MNSHRLSSHVQRDVYSEWLADQAPDKRAEYKDYLKNSTEIFEKLRKMIQKRYDNALHVREEDYDHASWAYKQAHLNGKLEALEEIYKLLP